MKESKALPFLENRDTRPFSKKRGLFFLSDYLIGWLVEERGLD